MINQLHKDVTERHGTIDDTQEAILAECSDLLSSQGLQYAIILLFFKQQIKFEESALLQNCRKAKCG